MGQVRSVAPTASLEVNSLLGGTAWTGRITFGFNNNLPADAGVGASGVSPVATHVRAAVRAAFAQVEAFTNLDIAETPAAARADVRIMSADRLYLGSAGANVIELGAYGFHPGVSAAAGDIYFGRSATFDVSPGSYGFRTVLHEAGHALGLKHPSESGRYATLPAAMDSQELSVMSDRSTPGAAIADGLGTEPGGFAETYMPADILALQHLYGANYEDDADSHYIFNPADRIMMRTIWDGGGRDTYDFNAYSDDLDIDLAAGGFSTTGQEAQLNRAQELSHGAAPVYADGAVHNAYLFKGRRDSLIENARGGRGDDTIEGNQANNRLAGDRGDDVLIGENGRDSLLASIGDDVLKGGFGDDFMSGSYGADSFVGGPGDDIIRGGMGADTAFGGSGDDIITAAQGNDIVWGDAGDDTLYGHDGRDFLRGGFGDDELIGGNGDDGLSGGWGNDTLYAGAGGDTLTGGPGRDVFVVEDVTRITDFKLNDIIDISNPAAALHRAVQVGAHVEISLPSTGEFVRLLNIDIGTIGLEHFM